MKKKKVIPKAIRIRRQKKRLDLLWAAAVKKRDDYVCMACGAIRPKGLTADHIFSRSKNSTRWNIDNGVSLCGIPCHIYHKRHQPMKWSLSVLQMRGMEFIERLEKIHDSTVDIDLDAVERALTELVSDGGLTSPQP